MAEALSKLATARAIMTAFADQTGLSNPEHPPRRYLWTDSHAVCVFLGLYSESGEPDYRQLVTTLIDQVHEVLGRHRDDDSRTGWISGMGEDEGRAHPTAGGLRIGKKLRERRRGEPVDEALEWDRDGQYFHYLTKWMHALCRAARVLDERRYSHWALELARAAYAGFVTAAPGGKRLHWKMSIDLSYPLVRLSGQHDPLDGYVTYREIARSVETGLEDELADLEMMIAGRDWSTSDPLGIGGLLFDACRLVQQIDEGDVAESRLVASLLESAEHSLGQFARDPVLRLPAGHRLAFRELGLCIGLHAVEFMNGIISAGRSISDGSIIRRLDALRGYLTIAGAIESFWSVNDNQRCDTWRAHADINAVTLATSLLPDEFLRG